MVDNFMYLISLTVLLIVFFIFSFKKELNIKSHVKYLLPAIVISTALFIMFELRFVEFEIWTYHTEYLIGLNYMNIPFETWLYYIVMSLVGFLIYRVVSIKKPFNINANYFVLFSLVLLAVFAILAYTNRKLIYTFVIFMFLTVFFGYVIFRGRFKKHYQAFYISFLVGLAPFFILNKITAGLPVITYNTAYITGVGLFGVPLENMVSFFMLFLVTISVYEYLAEKRFY